jgi:hypothetical protein
MRISGLFGNLIRPAFFVGDFCTILQIMVDTLIDTVMPSAIPTEEEIAAWQECRAMNSCGACARC